MDQYIRMIRWRVPEQIDDVGKRFKLLAVSHEKCMHDLGRDF
jgi:hypothetical protein